MTTEIEFINGLSFKAPNVNAPGYVKCRGWIKNAELIEFLQARIAKGEESTNFDVKVSQGGKWYAAVDNWKPQNGNGPRQATARREAPKAGGFDDGFKDSDIPFVTNRGAF